VGELAQSHEAPFAGSSFGRCEAGTCWGLSLQASGPNAGTSVYVTEQAGEATMLVGTLGGAASGGFAHYVVP
jgi:hypothetical protein